MVRRSAHKNIMELAEQQMLARKESLRPDIHKEVEKAFTAAEKDPALIKPLGALLQKHNVFKMYEDRFFSLLGH